MTKQLSKFARALGFLKRYFVDKRVGWIVVSGAAVYLYGNKERELTDLDIVVQARNIFDVEAMLRQSKLVDGLSAVRFVGKFGRVSPLTPFLRMFIHGVEVHISNDWLYRTDNGQIIHIPYDETAFGTARTLLFEKIKVRAARPELIFMCKSITDRTFKDNGSEKKKDEKDCHLLVKNVSNFDFNYLKSLYETVNREDLFPRFALPIKKIYNR